MTISESIKEENYAWTCWDEKTETQQQTNLTIQLEAINQKVFMKEGRLKIYCDWVKQYRHNRIFQNNVRKSCQEFDVECTKTQSSAGSKRSKINLR